MPKFSKTGKEQIREKLCAEGQQLFTAHGIKKVTIDELAAAANIAKATFYRFYDSKESLYLDIAQELQLKIFAELDAFLAASHALPNKQRVREMFREMHALMIQYPILSQIDSDTLQLISRKVPNDRLASFLNQNLDAVFLLQQHDIRFLCAPETASCAFMALYQGWASLHDKDATLQTAVSDILLNGVIEQIISDDNGLPK